jgi:SAM-dependent methyltransferase
MDLSETKAAHAADAARGGIAARHPWEIARARHFVDLTAPLLPLAGARVLDVGAGDAFVARALLDRVEGARVLAWDPNYVEDEMRALAAVPRLDVTRTPPEQGGFDIATVLDVLEHVADEASLLRQVVKLVKPGGAIVVSVPAWPSLHGLHDMKLRHLRRYTPEQARAIVEREGLRVERCGGLFHSLLPVRALTTRLEGKIGLSFSGVSTWDKPLVSGALNAALRADTLLSRALASIHVDAPGLSWWCVART